MPTCQPLQSKKQAQKQVRPAGAAHWRRFGKKNGLIKHAAATYISERQKIEWRTSGEQDEWLRRSTKNSTCCCRINVLMVACSDTAGFKLMFCKGEVTQESTAFDWQPGSYGDVREPLKHWFSRIGLIESHVIYHAGGLTSTHMQSLPTANTLAGSKRWIRFVREHRRSRHKGTLQRTHKDEPDYQHPHLCSFTSSLASLIFSSKGSFYK